MIRGASRKPIAVGVDQARVHARDLHQRSQARLARAGQRAQPGAHEPAVLAAERHDVGHRGERDEIEVLVRRPRVLARGLEQRLGELVRDRGGAQVGARVAADRRVHDRRGRQPPVGARGVVVGHHDLEPGRARGRHLLDRGDRAVDGHQQVRPALGEPGDGGGGEAVAVVDPARQVPVHLRAQRAQRAHEHRGGRDAVDVVVAVDRDPRAAAGVVEDHRGGVAQAAEGVERMRFGGGEERARLLHVAEPAPDEHLREHVRDAERGRQPLGGGVVVRGDGEAGLDRWHGRRSVWAAHDGTGAFRPAPQSRHGVVAES